MKKIFIVVLSALLAAFIFTGCGAKDKPATFTLYVPDEAPVLSVAQLYEKQSSDAISDGYKLDFNLTTGTNIATLLKSKTPDFAVAPINVCAVMANQTNGEYVLAGVNIWGIISIVTSRSDISSISDLVGKTVYAYQKDATPGLTLKASIDFELGENNYKELSDSDKTIDETKVNIFYINNANMMGSVLKGDNAEFKDAEIGIMAEPASSMAVAETAGSSKELTKAIKLSEIWKKHNDGQNYPQVGFLVRKSLVENHRGFVDNVAKAVKDNITFATQNADSARAIADLCLNESKINSSRLPKNKDIITNFLTDETKPLDFMYAHEARTEIESYFNALTANGTKNMSVVGGKMPGDEFYLSAAA